MLSFGDPKADLCVVLLHIQKMLVTCLIFFVHTIMLPIGYSFSHDGIHFCLRDHDAYGSYRKTPSQIRL